jgi:hypothetical protein
VIHNEYIVVVGRRALLNSEAQERRGEHHARGQRIVTYDRLLDQAINLDSGNGL